MNKNAPLFRRIRAGFVGAAIVAGALGLVGASQAGEVPERLGRQIELETTETTRVVYLYAQVADGYELTKPMPIEDL